MLDTEPVLGKTAMASYLGELQPKGKHYCIYLFLGFIFYVYAFVCVHAPCVQGQVIRSLELNTGSHESPNVGARN